MTTLMMLMITHDQKTYIPAEEVCTHYFGGMSLDKFYRKINSGEILLPLTKTTSSQKSPKLVALRDLEVFLEARNAEAQREVDLRRGDDLCA